tara:strand:- start:7176 stop:7649 length:474 start_codon:yes stop_codon:yes gene_type:complete
MRKLRILLLFIFSIHLAYSSNNLKEIRDFYYKVGLEKVELEDFEYFLNKKKKISYPALEGYRAVVWFLKAKDFYNPYRKYEAFVEGKKQLELLIQKYPSNIELHFLRLTIQDHLPIFLGYNNQIDTDKKFIKTNLQDLKNDSDLKARIEDYLTGKDK